MPLPRILTALVGIPLVLLLVHLGSFPYVVFILAAVGLALFEYGAVLSAGRVQNQRWLLVFSGLVLAAAVGFFPPALDPELRGRIPAIALTLVISLGVLRELFRKDHSWDRAAMSVFGVLFIAWPLSHLMLLRALRPGGEALTYILFACIWASDTAAWAVGMRWGRTRLAPVVSPKKSWEGFWGGAVAGGVVLLIGNRLAGLGLSAGAAAGLGAFTAGLGQVSDLTESLVKRRCGVKDSGALLPGHGGVLDRFDSFYLVAPFFYYFWAFRTDLL